MFSPLVIDFITTLSLLVKTNHILFHFQFCNLFETASASEWLMYISEWDAPGGGLPLSNIRVTTKVAVNALLGDTPNLVNYGSALMANLGDKEVKAVVCILQLHLFLVTSSPAIDLQNFAI